MSSFIVLLSFIVSTLQTGVILIPNIPGCPPTRICEINGLDDVVASANNLPYLMTMLYNHGIESAAVGGWNDHISYDFVVRANGAVAPYSPATNDACYAFCIPRGKGCNRRCVYPTPCQTYAETQQNCGSPVTPSQHCLYVQPLVVSNCVAPAPQTCAPVVSVPSTCVEKEDSCSSERECDPCVKYVKQQKNVYKNKSKSDKCKDRVCGALEEIKTARTYVFKSCDLSNRKKVKFCEVTNRATDLAKWVELKPVHDKKGATCDGYPTLLRYPAFLYEFRKYIACKYEYPCPCLYVDCNGCLYVRIKETLYLVKFKRSIEYSCQSGFKHLKLCPVEGKCLDKLVQSGLSGVVFQELSSRC